jgi:hypothetical protein
MKTLKITIVATLASTLAWWVGVPQHVWPSHPIVADTLLAVIVYYVVLYAWSDSKAA